MSPALLLSLAVLAQASAEPLPVPASAPTDDYGLTGWCYGAVKTYADLYDQVMPEVTRIEKAFPSADGVDAALKEYPVLRDKALADAKLFAEAIQTAEKASPSVISNRGAEAVAKGRAIWTGSDTRPKAEVARAWMGWSPPAVCEPTAKRLKTNAGLLGKALVYNNKPVEAAPVEAAADPAPADDGSFMSEPKVQ